MPRDVHNRCTGRVDTTLSTIACLALGGCTIAHQFNASTPLHTTHNQWASLSSDTTNVLKPLDGLESDLSISKACEDGSLEASGLSLGLMIGREGMTELSTGEQGARFTVYDSLSRVLSKDAYPCHLHKDATFQPGEQAGTPLPPQLPFAGLRNPPTPINGPHSSA